MKLSVSEFEAMQMPWRKWYIKNGEIRNFRKFGLEIEGKDLLEVGCGSGYAASVLCKEHPETIESDIMEMMEMLKCGLGRWNEMMTYPFPFKFLREYLDNASEKYFSKHWTETF